MRFGNVPVFTMRSIYLLFDRGCASRRLGPGQEKKKLGTKNSYLLRKNVGMSILFFVQICLADPRGSGDPRDRRLHKI